MLTSDLLATKISKGKIEPVYALLNLENQEVARSVIDIFKDHLGRTYGELIGELEGLEERSTIALSGDWLSSWRGDA